MPDHPSLIEENSCEWHQLWEPAEEEEVVDGEVVDESVAVVPYTGELLSLREMSFEQLGRVLDEAREFETVTLRGFKREVGDEILERMDANAADGVEGAWTVHEGGYKLSGDSPNQTEYNLAKLKEKLGELVERGVIKQEAVNKVIVPSGWKVAKRPLVQLAKLGGEIKAAIDECEETGTKPRRVQVSLEVSR